MSDDTIAIVLRRIISNLEYCNAIERKIDKIGGALVTLSLVGSEEDSEVWEKQFKEEMAELFLPTSLNANYLNFIDEGMRQEYEKKLKSIGSSLLYLVLCGHKNIDLSAVNLNKE